MHASYKTTSSLYTYHLLQVCYVVLEQQLRPCYRTKHHNLHFSLPGTYDFHFVQIHQAEITYCLTQSWKNGLKRRRLLSPVQIYLFYSCIFCLAPLKVSLKNSKIYTKFYCNHTRDTSRVKYNKYYDAILHLLNYSSKHKFTHSKYTKHLMKSHWSPTDIWYIWAKDNNFTRLF